MMKEIFVILIADGRGFVYFVLMFIPLIYTK